MALVWSPTVADRYWSYVTVLGAEEHWPWTGALAQRFDHGVLYVGRDGDRHIVWYAHRVGWMLAHGEPPPAEQKVRHRCDRPWCQNPRCWELGTQADNVADMMERGRNRQVGRPGEAHHNAVLTAELVTLIRSRVAAGEMQKVLAAEVGVSKQQISKIVRDQRWTA